MTMPNNFYMDQCWHNPISAQDREHGNNAKQAPNCSNQNGDYIAKTKASSNFLLR